MTQKEAQKACRWFQDNIGLAGWTITVSLKDKPACMGHDETPDQTALQLGHSWTLVRCHDCRVWINPEPGVTFSLEDTDKLLTLFHELLHGLFESIGIQYDVLHEFTIDQLSHVLAGQYRANSIVTSTAKLQEKTHE